MKIRVLKFTMGNTKMSDFFEPSERAINGGSGSGTGTGYDVTRLDELPVGMSDVVHFGQIQETSLKKKIFFKNKKLNDGSKLVCICHMDLQCYEVYRNPEGGKIEKEKFEKEKFSKLPKIDFENMGLNETIIVENGDFKESYLRVIVSKNNKKFSDSKFTCNYDKDKDYFKITRKPIAFGANNGYDTSGDENDQLRDEDGVRNGETKEQYDNRRIAQRNEWRRRNGKMIEGE